jgi:hypothetical protein
LVEAARHSRLRCGIRIGEWPTTLDELVPKYLNEVPRNPSTGKPVTFEVRDGQPIVKEWGFMR